MTRCVFSAVVIAALALGCQTDRSASGDNADAATSVSPPPTPPSPPPPSLIPGSRAVHDAEPVYPEASEPLFSPELFVRPDPPSWVRSRDALAFEMMRQRGAVDALSHGRDEAKDAAGLEDDPLDLESCNGAVQAGATRRGLGALRQHARFALDVVRRVPSIAAAYASGALVHLDPQLILDAGETPSSAPGRPQLAATDRKGLEEVFKRHPGGAERVLGGGGGSWCSSAFVVCDVVKGELRVSGLRVVPVVPPGWDSDDVCSASPADASDELVNDLRDYNPPGLPFDALPMLPRLRFVVLGDVAVGGATEEVAGKDGGGSGGGAGADAAAEARCRFLRSVPALEVLALSVTALLPPSCALPGLKSLRVFWGQHEFVAPVDIGGPRVGPAGEPRATLRVDESHVCFASNSPGLVMLAGVALPACLRANTELLHVDVRGGWLRGPLPSVLASWTKLVNFVGFGQGPISDYDAPGTHGCRLGYEEKSADSDDEGEVGKRADQLDWFCESHGWSVVFDDPSHPWWSWSNVERFWVDMNFFTGQIPPWLPDRWPRLRTLDLYSNQLTGPVPVSLCRLTQLDTLQLHDNRLSGEFPFAEMVDGACPWRPGADPTLFGLGLGLNPRLGGCVARALLHPDRGVTAKVTLNYTGVRVVDDPAECDRAAAAGAGGGGWDTGDDSSDAVRHGEL